MPCALFKGRVGKPVSERITDRYAVFVVVTVTDLGSVRIHFVYALSEGLVRRHVFIAERPRFGELAGRIDFPEEQLRRRLAAALTGKIHIEDRVCVVVEGQFHGRAAEEHDNDRLTGFAHLVDQTQMRFGQFHILAVAALALVLVCQSRKNKDFVAIVNTVILNAARSEGVFGRGEPGGVDHRTARALIAHPLEHLAADM